MSRIRGPPPPGAYVLATPPHMRGPPPHMQGPPPHMRGPSPMPGPLRGPPLHGSLRPPGPYDAPYQGPYVGYQGLYSGYQGPPDGFEGPYNGYQRPYQGRDQHDSYRERAKSPGPRGRALSPGREPDAKHLPLARCRVLYLGSAVPTETARGLEAVQIPLRERFPIDDGEVPGIDAWLTVFSSGIMMQYVADSDAVNWFPIQTLYVCAAVKCTVNVSGLTGERSPRFVALDSRDAAHSSYPPMFCAIMRRTKGVKVLECHAFIAKSNESALTLVKATTHAFKHEEGWSMSEPPQARIRQAIHLIPADPIEEKEKLPEYYKPPPKEGYFYSTNKDVIRNYNVKERRIPHPYMSDPYGAPGAPKVGQLPPHPNSYFNDWDDFGEPVFVHNGAAPPENIYGPLPGRDNHRLPRQEYLPPRDRGRSPSPRRSAPLRRNSPPRREPPTRHYSPPRSNLPRRESPPRRYSPPRQQSPPRQGPTNPHHSPSPHYQSNSDLDDFTNHRQNLVDNNFSFGPPNIGSAPREAPIIRDNPIANLANYSNRQRGDVRNIFS